MRSAVEISNTFEKGHDIIDHALSLLLTEIIKYIDTKLGGAFGWVLNKICPLSQVRRRLEDDLIEIGLRQVLRSESVTPRGIRNNNWGNIKLNPRFNWIGQIIGEDKVFVTFSNPFWGLRALVRISFSYNRKYKIDTVEKFIRRFAPKSENDTVSYIEYVLSKVECNAIKLKDKDYMRSFIKAICEIENGRYEMSKVWCDRLFDAAYDYETLNK